MLGKKSGFCRSWHREPALFSEQYGIGEQSETVLE